MAQEEQAIAFVTIFIGGILGIAGITGSSIHSVVQGKPDKSKVGTVSNSGSEVEPPSHVSSKGFPTGVGSYEGIAVAKWIIPILEYAKKHGWKGRVTSGYRSRAEQERIYNSGVRPAAVPGTSNHEQSTFPGGAVDVTDAQELSEILKKSPFATFLIWAGSKDPVHFSFPHNGGY